MPKILCAKCRRKVWIFDAYDVIGGYKLCLSCIVEHDLEKENGKNKLENV